MSLVLGLGLSSRLCLLSIKPWLVILSSPYCTPIPLQCISSILFRPHSNFDREPIVVTRRGPSVCLSTTIIEQSIVSYFHVTDMICRRRPTSKFAQRITNYLTFFQLFQYSIMTYIFSIRNFFSL